MSTILIVANQTLPSEALAITVSSRIASGDRAAEERLARFVGSLSAQGVTASGEIGDRDPVAAVRDAARGRDVSEIVLSTLPAGISRWLRQDVPSRMRGALAVPVTVVEEAPVASPG
jgi:hypothetical protein